MHTDLDSLLAFVRFTHSFQQVKRVIYAAGEDRRENDAEHSYQLAMVGWYLIQSAQVPLDTSKVIAYSLTHDLVEVAAGDTYFYTDSAEQAAKKQREARAATELAQLFPEFPDLHALIQGYEARADAEAAFVYALDKVLPMLNIYLDNGRTWQEKGITLRMLKEAKADKVALSPEIEPLFYQIVELLEKEPELFSGNTEGA